VLLEVSQVLQALLLVLPLVLPLVLLLPLLVLAALLGQVLLQLLVVVGLQPQVLALALGLQSVLLLAGVQQEALVWVQVLVLVLAQE
jgi:hypothetical protein